MPSPHPQNTRERILLTAIGLFADCGYAGVSMRDIATAVGISPPALYNHFANKEALYREAVSTAFADKSARLLQALRNDVPALTQLHDFVHGMTRELDEDDRFRRLLQRELLDADAQRLTFLGRFIFDEVQQPFMALLKSLRPQADAFLLSEMIFGMVKQHYELQPIHPHTTAGIDAHRSAVQIADAVLAVLRPYFSGD